MHGAVGATAAAVEGGLSADDVEEVVVTVPAAGVDLVLEPAAAKIAPRTAYEAKFSLQYSAAAMLVHGRCGVTTYAPDAIRDERVLDLARRVRYEVKDYPSYPAAFPGGVRITTRDGRTFEADLEHQRGGPENPMTPDEVREKYRENASLALDETTAAALEEAMLALEEQNDLRAALAPLAAAGAAEAVTA
jgi:2-methylcitrate dehydratase PrpD